MSKIFIAHSKGYLEKALELARRLEADGHSVYVPLRDTHQNVSIQQICESNRRAIIEADEVRVIWDGTSHGVIFDAGMAFALGKPIKTEFVTEKSIKDLIRDFGRD